MRLAIKMSASIDRLETDTVGPPRTSTPKNSTNARHFRRLTRKYLPPAPEVIQSQSFKPFWLESTLNIMPQILT